MKSWQHKSLISWRDIWIWDPLGGFACDVYLTWVTVSWTIDCYCVPWRPHGSVSCFKYSLDWVSNLQGAFALLKLCQCRNIERKLPLALSTNVPRWHTVKLRRRIQLIWLWSHRYCQTFYSMVMAAEVTLGFGICGCWRFGKPGLETNEVEPWDRLKTRIDGDWINNS